MRRTLAVGTVAAAMVLLAGPVSAQQIVGAGSGLADPTETLDFNDLGLADGTEITDQFAGSGVTFSPGLFYDGTGTQSGASFAPGYLYNFGAAEIVDPFWILFSSAVNGAAFQFETDPAESVFSAYLGATLVSTFAAATVCCGVEGSALWYGFENMTFDRILVDAGSASGASALDNLQVAGVPEPLSVLLLGSGLIGLGTVFLRRREDGVFSS